LYDFSLYPVKPLLIAIGTSSQNRISLSPTHARNKKGPAAAHILCTVTGQFLVDFNIFCLPEGAAGVWKAVFLGSIQVKCHGQSPRTTRLLSGRFSLPLCQAA
jgi:hypothetical protein